MLRYELERICIQTGSTHAEVGARLDVSRASFSQMVAGKNLPSRSALEVIAHHHGYASRLPHLLELLRTARHGEDDTPQVPGQELVTALEAYAKEIITADALTIPPLAQSPSYARALMRTEAQRGSHIDSCRELTLLARRQLALNEPISVPFTCLVDEAALNRAVGEREVMAGQYAHLFDLASRPNVTFIVIPNSAYGLTAVHGGLNLIRYKDDIIVWHQTWIALHHHNDSKVVNRVQTALAHARTRALSRDDSVALVSKLYDRLR